MQLPLVLKKTLDCFHHTCISTSQDMLAHCYVKNWWNYPLSFHDTKAPLHTQLHTFVSTVLHICKTFSLNRIMYILQSRTTEWKQFLSKKLLNKFFIQNWILIPSFCSFSDNRLTVCYSSAGVLHWRPLAHFTQQLAACAAGPVLSTDCRPVAGC